MYMLTAEAARAREGKFSLNPGGGGVGFLTPSSETQEKLVWASEKNRQRKVSFSEDVSTPKR